MTVADFDVADFDGSKKALLDKQLLVKFFYRTRPDSVETQAQGRPIFKDVEYIDIRVPGSRGTSVCRPARPADKQRFPEHYEAFKNRVEAPVSGTPLAEWALIPRSVVEQLSFANVKTVEQLAVLADSFAGQMHGGYGYKKMAKDYLERTGIDADKAVIDDLKKQNEDLKAQLQDLTEKIESLPALEDAPTKKRVLSEEAKAKMAAGRKKAAKKRKRLENKK
jgi:hypothetical protein